MPGPHTSPLLFDSYQIQSVYGSPAAGSSRQFGTGSGEIQKLGNNMKSRLLGSTGLSYIKGGGATTRWNFNFDTVHDANPIQLAQRVSGHLQWFTVHSGWNEAAPIPDVGWHCQDCKVDTMSLRLSAGDSPGALSGSMAGFGRQVVQNTAVETPADPPSDPFLAYEAFFVLGGIGSELDSFEFTVNHNLREHWVIAAQQRTGQFQRFWDYLLEGNIDITGTFTMYEPWTLDVHENCVENQSGVLRLVNLCNSQILQLTFTGITFDEEQQRTPNDGSAQLYTYPWTAKTFAIGTV